MKNPARFPGRVFYTLRKDIFLYMNPVSTSRSQKLKPQVLPHRLYSAFQEIHGSRFYPEIGGLISYGTSVTNSHREAGACVGRILKDAKPADVPIMQSSKFELAINVHTAKLLGLTLPPTLLSTADEVIE